MSEFEKGCCEETAHRIWNESEMIASRKERIRQESGKEFLAYLSEFLKQQFDIDAAKSGGENLEIYGCQMYNSLKDQPPSDKVLVDEITNLLTKILNLPHEDDEEIKIKFDDSYLRVFKALWGEGVPLYLARFVNRREAMNFLKLIYLWKPSLEKKINELEEKGSSGNINESKIHNKKRQKLVMQAEKEVWGEIKNTFEELCTSLFDKDVSQIFPGDLSTNSVSELQQIFKEEDGCTKKSWEKKYMAYLKLTYIFALIKILGTIDFERLKKVRGGFQEKLIKHKRNLDLVGAEVEETRIDIKTRLSVVLKYLKKMLNERAGYYPADIRDLVRLRISVAIPDVFIEDESIEEVKDCIVNVLKTIIPVFGASYVRNRLRNSFVSGKVNSFSGANHRALQVTFLSLMDVEERRCPESVPLEVQIRKGLSEEERKKDDLEYKTKKINRLRHDSGVDVKFADYVSHIADIFIKKADFNDKEQKGGEPWLSEKELLAVDFLKIISTDDEETKEYLRDEWGSNKAVYKRKLSLAVREISNYWSNKLKLFIENKIRLMQQILEKRCDETNLQAAKRFKSTAEDILDNAKASQPNFDTIKSCIGSLRVQAGFCSEGCEKDTVNRRLFNKIFQIERYFGEREKINISELLENASDSLARFFS